MILKYDPDIVLKVQVTGRSSLNGNLKTRYEAARPSPMWKEWHGSVQKAKLVHMWDSVHVICLITAELKMVDKGSFLEKQTPPCPTLMTGAGVRGPARDLEKEVEPGGRGGGKGQRENGGGQVHSPGLREAPQDHLSQTCQVTG